MGGFSPYDIDEAKPPDWLPGERLAAMALLGICFYLAIDNQVNIYRTFTRKQGLYFWSLEIGIWGVVFDAIGMIFKFIDPKPRIWPLYTLALTLGWGAFSTAQVLVLYSRLHLVLRDQRIQRFVFYMAWSSVPLIVVPICVVAWPAWYPYDHALSAQWSPRDAIVERYSQLAYTVIETIISSLYIWSLWKLLRSKVTVRQRRVMWDLIYVNALCILFDSITIVLVYLNQPQLDHPAQVFAYMLKFRLEFVVLNQLMAVAARGVHRETVVDKRYHHDSTNDSIGGTGFQDPFTQRSKKRSTTSKDPAATEATQISAPQPALPKGGPRSQQPFLHQDEKCTHRSDAEKEDCVWDEAPGFAQEDKEHVDRSGDDKVDSTFDHIANNAEPGEGGVDSPITPNFENGPSTDTVQRSESGPSNDQTHLIKHPKSGAKSRHLGTFRTRIHHRHDDDENDDDEDEIALHMWENNGKLALDAPWFKSKVSV